jgi:hypothetical protein
MLDLWAAVTRTDFVAAVFLTKEQAIDVAERNALCFESLPAGTRVLLQRLVAKPEYNGERARVLSFNERTRRYIVALDDGKELSLKSECVAWVGKGDDPVHHSDDSDDDHPTYAPIAAADMSSKGHPLPHGAGVNFVKRVEWPAGPVDISPGAILFVRIEIDEATGPKSFLTSFFGEYDSMIMSTHVLGFASKEAAVAHKPAPGRQIAGWAWCGFPPERGFFGLAVGEEPSWLP